MHSAPEDAADREYLHLFFFVGRLAWRALYRRTDKCNELRWTDGSALPADLVDYVAEALTAIRRGESLALRGW